MTEIIQERAAKPKKKLAVLDLFSGIGGFSLGLERTGGFETVAFCEIEEFPRKVLRKHWPEVPIYDDVRTLTADILGRDGIAVDVITGGFPCQDISVCGRRAGLEGEYSGLWFEVSRLVCELRPKYIVVENSPSLLKRGMGEILGDLADVGYDAEWEGIPAAAVGAAHFRAREWVVAYPTCQRDRVQEAKVFSGRRPSQLRGRWPGKSSVRRVADGFPGRVDRLRALGNAVVPQIPELIGRAILAAEAA